MQAIIALEMVLWIIANWAAIVAAKKGIAALVLLLAVVGAVA